MRGCALRKVVRNLAHKNWKTGESNPSTSLHRSRDQRQPVGPRWAGGWQKNPERESGLFKRETEHLCLRQPRSPIARA